MSSSASRVPSRCHRLVDKFESRLPAKKGSAPSEEGRLRIRHKLKFIAASVDDHDSSSSSCCSSLLELGRYEKAADFSNLPTTLALDPRSAGFHCQW
eukprot:scaffold1619_cov161-Amphora_coffeaeformis.AAC.5